MSEPVTEIAIIPVLAGIDLASGDTGTIWTETLRTIQEQPGCIALYWGRQVESPDTIDLCVEWETLQHHKTFMTNPIYAPFLTRLKPLLSGDVSLYHIAPTHGPLSTPFAAPVTECLSLYLPASYPSSTYNDNFTNFKRGGEETGKDIIGGITGGWSIEPHEHDSVGKDAKLFAAFIGWPSVQAHMAYRETEEFPSVAKYLRDGPKGVKVCHVEFRKF